jgi:hypothetical protein
MPEPFADLLRQPFPPREASGKLFLLGRTVSAISAAIPSSVACCR